MKRKVKSGIDVLSPSVELARLLSQSPKMIERELVKQGEELLGVFFDERATVKKFKNLKKLQQDVIKQAIEDVAKGLDTLRTSTIGIVNKQGKAKSYIATHGSHPDGDVLFSISWKNIVAFQTWRKENDPQDDISQETINAAVYKLTVLLADLMRE